MVLFGGSFRQYLSSVDLHPLGTCIHSMHATHTVPYWR